MSIAADNEMNKSDFKSRLMDLYNKARLAQQKEELSRELGEIIILGLAFKAILKAAETGELDQAIRKIEEDLQKQRDAEALKEQQARMGRIIPLPLGNTGDGVRKN